LDFSTVPLFIGDEIIRRKPKRVIRKRLRKRQNRI